MGASALEASSFDSSNHASDTGWQYDAAGNVIENVGGIRAYSAAYTCDVRDTPRQLALVNGV